MFECRKCLKPKHSFMDGAVKKINDSSSCFCSGATLRTPGGSQGPETHCATALQYVVVWDVSLNANVNSSQCPVSAVSNLTDLSATSHIYRFGWRQKYFKTSYKACWVIMQSGKIRSSNIVGLFVDLIKIWERVRNETTGGCFERGRTIRSLWGERAGLESMKPIPALFFTSLCILSDLCGLNPPFSHPPLFLSLFW